MRTNLITNINFPSLNEVSDRLENKIENLSKRKSEKTKNNFMKVVLFGSLLLFITAYATTPTMQNNNEFSIGTK